MCNGDDDDDESGVEPRRCGWVPCRRPCPRRGWNKTEKKRTRKMMLAGFEDGNMGIIKKPVKNAEVWCGVVWVGSVW